ncbi:hypothetical protein IW261DRAFT_1508066 [Armillaria novae-zelandiae]|uniref:Uncharacterized protein n=1 Tax=Armillaria novae-zelandiae TaxID=153914 RepID=A0AA39NVQ6_9AGAR|nr:hypothetical protein IW261DRAFT_1508066 [Armillaria novae-zelandiae]
MIQTMNFVEVSSIRGGDFNADGGGMGIGTDGGSTATTMGFSMANTAAVVPVDGIAIVTIVPAALLKSVVIMVGWNFRNDGYGKRRRNTGSSTMALAISPGRPAAVITAAEVLACSEEKFAIPCNLGWGQRESSCVRNGTGGRAGLRERRRGPCQAPKSPEMSR